MAQSGSALHESPDTLDPAAIDRHRAIVSLTEELEAVDWYDQRVQACTDDELRKILVHNRDEEKEHAAMLIEWLRKNDSKFDGHLRTYLFQNNSPTQIEAHESSVQHAAAHDESLGSPA